MNIKEINPTSYSTELVYVENQDNSHLEKIDESLLDGSFNQAVYDYFVTNWGDDDTFSEWLNDNKETYWFDLQKDTDGKYYAVCGNANGVVYIEEVASFDIEYNSLQVTIHEDTDNLYIDFNTGLGEGIYPKEDWTLDKALYDQAHIYDEQK